MQGLQVISWGVANFFYNFQVPFMEQAGLITIGLGTFMLLKLRDALTFFCDSWRNSILYLILAIFSIGNLAYSVNGGTEISNGLRFLLIMLLIPLCPYFVGKKDGILYKIFALLSFSKAIMLIVIAILVIQSGSHAEMRAWAQLNDYGDVYFMGGTEIPHVQLKGNALIVVAFFISFFKKKKFTFYNSTLFLGILAAGNFAFYLGTVIFFVWLFLRKLDWNHVRIKQFIAAGVLFALLIGFSQYAIWQTEEKGGSPDSSNGMRILQAEILTDTDPLYGKGLGSIVKDASKMGRSIDSQYYELQPLYIYYQVGLPCILLFYVLMILTMKRRCSKDGLILFCIYLFYAFFNPYCLDTTQMIVMIILAMQFPVKKRRMSTGCYEENR